MPNITSVNFTNRYGTLLAGRLNRPTGQWRGTAVFAHCFTCSKDSLAAGRVAQGLAQRGIAVLRFDFTGLGQSSGDFASSGFAGNLTDLEDACAYLAEHYQAPELLIGHSLGGAAVLALADKVPSIKGVATIGAPAVAGHVLHLFDGQQDKIIANGRAEIMIGGRPFEVEKSFIDDLQARTNLDHITQLKADLLLLHAPMDQIVSIDNAAEIFTAAKHPKSFVSLDKADHLLTGQSDAEFAAAIIAAWAGRIINDNVERPVAKQDEVVVSSSPDGPFAFNIAAGKHMLRADEPVSVTGGHDSGPAPYEFLLASLGACTAMTLRMYAARKHWPLEDVQVTLHHEKKPVLQDDGASKRPDHIRRQILIKGPLDDVQMARLLEIANKCPVHKTLEQGVDVSTQLG